jgi:hypothetical protein
MSSAHRAPDGEPGIFDEYVSEKVDLNCGPATTAPAITRAIAQVTEPTRVRTLPTYRAVDARMKLEQAALCSR